MHAAACMGGRPVVVEQSSRRKKKIVSVCYQIARTEYLHDGMLQQQRAMQRMISVCHNPRTGIRDSSVDNRPIPGSNDFR